MVGGIDIQQHERPQAQLKVGQEAGHRPIDIDAPEVAQQVPEEVDQYLEDYAREWMLEQVTWGFDAYGSIDE